MSHLFLVVTAAVLAIFNGASAGLNFALYAKSRDDGHLVIAGLNTGVAAMFIILIGFS